MMLTLMMLTTLMLTLIMLTDDADDADADDEADASDDADARVNVLMMQTPRVLLGRICAVATRCCQACR